MSDLEGSGTPNPRIPLGLNLEQAREVGKGSAVHQLQQNFQALSNEGAKMSIDLREILAHLREDPGGGRRRALATPRDDSSSSQSSSSQEELWPRRERRSPRQPADDLRDMRIDPPKLKVT